MAKKWSRCGALTGNNKIVSKLLENELKHWQRLHEIKGPFYCHKTGVYATVEDVTNPDYDPHVLVRIPGDPDLADSTRTHIYNLREEKWYRLESTIGDPLRRLIECDSPTEKELKIIFGREPSIYKSEGGFESFVLPLIRKSWPKLRTQDIISVQPMTAPSSLVFYMKHKYGKKPDADTA